MTECADNVLARSVVIYWMYRDVVGRREVLTNAKNRVEIVFCIIPVQRLAVLCALHCLGMLESQNT